MCFLLVLRLLRDGLAAAAGLAEVVQVFEAAFLDCDTDMCVAWRLRCLFTDGIGTPDPNPRNTVNWCFE